MLARVFNTPTPWRSPPPAGSQAGGDSAANNLPNSIYDQEYQDFIYGFVNDIPLIFFTTSNKTTTTISPPQPHTLINDSDDLDSDKSDSDSTTQQLTISQVLRASVGVIGESPLGITEKIVLSGTTICAMKRFRRVTVRKNEFGRRIWSIARIGKQCQYLVPLTAYLYTKRIKFLLSHYYPMGSLADLLSGAREQGQTALEWKHRLKIIQCIAKAIAFIHSQNAAEQDKQRFLQLNVHGNIKSSNVMINIDFSACLSDYGFIHLAAAEAEAEAAAAAAVVHDTGQPQPQPRPQLYDKTVSQESDVYNFGVVILDILGWPSGNKAGGLLFEFCVEGKEEWQASKVFEISSNCTHRLSHARPRIHQIVSTLQHLGGSSY
ncbi:probable inactive receptor kinase At4g23740 [Andrographis paniculata]|uniref:probable inactive receptor kinase At4g23740 n=1 Tax=Andrographis paniculata TaxID=175694 RepID=UPI0021E79BD4|nr:probable inactive receptor kinase At4g23740 [Andrographis paniculata]